MSTTLPPEVPNISLPGPQLTTGEPERVFAVSHRRFVRLRNHIARLSDDPIKYAEGIGFACIGIAPSAFLAYFPWVAAYGQLNAGDQLKFAWVGPLMLAVVGASIVVAVLSFVMRSEVKGLRASNAVHIVEEMDEMMEPHRLNITTGDAVVAVEARQE